MPCSTEIAADELGDLLVEEIFSRLGLPRSIVSDRGSILTSEYWGTMCYYLAIKRRFSTAFHPQTDGQTERMNQTVESYLRCYVNYTQDDWVIATTQRGVCLQPRAERDYQAGPLRHGVPVRSDP